MSHTARIIIVSACLSALSACGTHRPPTPPPTPTQLVVEVRTSAGPLSQATVTVDSLAPQATGSDGRTTFSVQPGQHQVCAGAEGHHSPGLPQTPQTCVAATTLAVLVLERSAPPPPPPVTMRPLVIQGRNFREVGGGRWRWRMVTAFKLNDLVADGKIAEARAFLQWAKDTGFNGVRVISSLCCWFSLSAADGRAALPETLRLAAQYGMRVEIVALANTKEWSNAQIESHVKAVGAIAAQHSNALVQIANEHYHSTQSDALDDTSYLAKLAAMVPASVLTTESAGRLDEGNLPPQGEFITRHLRRYGRESPVIGNMVRRVNEMRALSSATGKPVVSDEPVGAGETNDGACSQTSPCSRRVEPEIFYCMGALARGMELGATFHCADCLHARVPGPKQQAAAHAFVRGATVMPHGHVGSYQNARSSGSPVSDFDESKAVRAYSFVAGERAFTVVVWATSTDVVSWRSGWTPKRVPGDYTACQVYEVTK